MAVPTDPTELERRYRGKLYTLEELIQKVQQWKKAQKRVVFTNGCFDLLHVGHIRALRHAKQLGDVLIVAVNSDRSVRAYKGEHLPIIPEEERLEVLSELTCVDCLLLFDETTVASLLLALKPHIHAKGRDYTEQTVPEREVVLSYGGQVAIVGDPKNHSSSWIIEKIQKLESKP